MRKLFIICSMMALGLGSAQAQTELGVFNHVGLGVGIGTTGISLEAAAPITPYAAVRAGANIFPSFTAKTDLDLKFDEATRQAYRTFTSHDLDSKIGVEGSPSFTTGHVLFDLFPSSASSFHFTVGAYFGGSEVVKVNNQTSGVLKDIYTFNTSSERQLLGVDKIGLALGDYFLEPDAQGNVEARIKVQSFRPYVGIGFGRPVPAKSRLTCNFDLGVQIWGSPKVYLKGANGETQLTEQNVDGNDGGVIKTLSKVAVWPVLNVRLVGRIF